MALLCRPLRHCDGKLSPLVSLGRCIFNDRVCKPLAWIGLSLLLALFNGGCVRVAFGPAGQLTSKSGLAGPHVAATTLPKSPVSIMTLAVMHEMEAVRTLLDSAVAQVQLTVTPHMQTLH